jgi:sigma-B regulation protein RsbU (phosphoserine phosphatase)
MLTPLLPTQETERLADLRALKILDTPPEERFDRIVRLAARIFEVPIAYIALVDSDRQWLKSKCGLRIDQTGRDVSFCGHAILHDDPLVIPDATLDERFSDNPLVLNEPRIRFYAGHPLPGPGGHNVGTLCLADRRPRNLSDAELETFRQLAALATHELQMVDLIQAQRELIETKNQLAVIQEKLAGELSEAAEYVRSLLPPAIGQGTVRTDWRFLTSSQLGGDLFGYHWLNDRQLAIYLLDVCGHGVGAALLSMSVHTALRRGTLPRASYDQPAEVLTALNRAFPMEENNNKFFTIWYGVYDTVARVLSYASGGHPPAMLLDGGQEPVKLEADGLIVGAMPHTDYTTHTQPIHLGSRLYLYSDGAFEIPTPQGQLLMVDGLGCVIARASKAEGSRIEQILQQIQTLQKAPTFADDLSLLEIEFN